MPGDDSQTVSSLFFGFCLDAWKWSLNSYFELHKHEMFAFRTLGLCV